MSLDRMLCQWNRKKLFLVYIRYYLPLPFTTLNPFILVKIEMSIVPGDCTTGVLPSAILLLQLSNIYIYFIEFLCTAVSLKLFTCTIRNYFTSWDCVWTVSRTFTRGANFTYVVMLSLDVDEIKRLQIQLILIFLSLAFIIAMCSGSRSVVDEWITLEKKLYAISK